MIVFGYGATFSLVFSFILGKKIVPYTSIEEGYRSGSFAFLGSFLLWVCWPVFNCCLYASTTFECNLMITNTIFAMAGSTMAMAGMTAFYKEGISMMVMHRAAVVGGVAIGCSAQIAYYPAIAIGIGFATGIGTFFSLRHLQGRFEMAWGLLDTCGTLSFGVLPSVMGAICSCLLLMAYDRNGADDKVYSLSDPNGVFSPKLDLQRKGGYQAGAAFVAMGIGVFIALITGFLIVIHYRENRDTFYNDDWQFDVALSNEEEPVVEYNLDTATLTRHKSSTHFNVP
jgi:ammonia channel protein AmtB